MDVDDQLKQAVEEYRFQVQFNWSRTQYLIALNVAILVAGTAVAAQGGTSAALVFLLGIPVAILTLMAVKTMHGYYRNTRDRMVSLELAAGIEQMINTTTSLGGRKRTVSVNQVIDLVLILIAVADAVGVGLMIHRWLST